MASLAVRVLPNARADACVGLMEDGVTFKIRLRAPAVEGKANRALLDFLSAELGVSKSALRLVRGEKARLKVIEVEGLPEAEIRARLLPFGA